jgi:hypothetical protein
MNSWLTRFRLLSAAVLWPAVAFAQHLDSTDLTVAGIPYLADTALVRRALGAPLSTDSITWAYADLQLTIDSGRVIRFWLKGASRATHRGLRVGDASARVAKLYERSCFESANVIQLCWRVDEFDSRGVVVQLNHGRVVGILVGHTFDP